MSFPRYPKYKPSGVEWLGDVPEHWDIAKFRHCFTESPEKIEDTVVGPMLSVSGYRGIEVKEYDDENRRRLDEELVGYRIVRPGQLVVNSMWLIAAGLGVSDFEGHVSPAYRSYWFDRQLDQRFIHHLMRSAAYVQGYTSMVQGIRPNSLQLSRDDLMALPVLIPSTPEQAAIASFLDRETAKIDGLVAEQRRLIELLKEKREAVISHAVTQGLNPHAPRKPSGIEWLGDVPEHWEVNRLKHVAIPDRGIQMGPFGGMLKELETEATPFKLYGQENTISNDFTSGSRWLTATRFSELREYELLPGDLVLTRKGASIGNCRQVPHGIQTGVIDSDTIRVRLNSNRISTDFAVTLMHEGYMESAILEGQKGAVLPGLNTGTISNLYIALPPLDEQQTIVRFIAEQSAKFDALTAEAERGIELLQERRTALISAAVTGQIDVRNLEGVESTLDIPSSEPEDIFTAGDKP